MHTSEPWFDFYSFMAYPRWCHPWGIFLLATVYIYIYIDIKTRTLTDRNNDV